MAVDPNPGSLPLPRRCAWKLIAAAVPMQVETGAAASRKCSSMACAPAGQCVVFVVVLVLLLKSFVAEAFVIPTGSMAETLLGYQKNVTCPECNYEFPVNCSQEVDPQQSEHTPVARLHLPGIGRKSTSCSRTWE